MATNCRTWCATARTKALAAASVTLKEFLASLPDYRPGRLERRAIVHGHCHQKALVGMEPTRQVAQTSGQLVD